MGWWPDGLSHQEAPQADGEEEAPQAAQEDADPAQEQEVALAYRGGPGPRAPGRVPGGEDPSCEGTRQTGLRGCRGCARSVPALSACQHPAKRRCEPVACNRML